MSEIQKLRVDKWLWHARFFKTRTQATQLAAQGRIRINGEKAGKASTVVKKGDVLTFPKERDIRVIEILALGSRRGPATEAATLYRDLQPPSPPGSEQGKKTAPLFTRRPGTGRPTKRDRRHFDRFRQKD
ncbi:MAG: RNA-binding S4 domain-containing protein [Parvibaculales bacterium]